MRLTSGSGSGEETESLCLYFFTYSGNKAITLQDCNDSGMRFVKHWNDAVQYYISVKVKINEPTLAG